MLRQFCRRVLLRRGYHTSVASRAHILCAGAWCYPAPRTRHVPGDNVNPVAGEILEEAGHRVTLSGPLSKAELFEKLPQFEGIIVRSSTQLDSEVFEKAGPLLRIVGRAGVGVDNIDCPAATRRGVLVMNTPGGNTQAAAELTWSLLMSLLRHVPSANTSLRGGKWDRKSYQGREARGKVLGVVGVGSIGQSVAGFARAMGMGVIGYDPGLAQERAEELGIRLEPSLEQVLRQADIISLHVPGGAATKHLLNKSTLAQCKRGVYIVNAARGGVIHSGDLLDALDEGHVAGAALDVFEEEPPTSDLLARLVAHPRVVATPHLGASTEEAQTKVARDIANQIASALGGRRLVGIVNAPHLALAQSDDAKPFVRLAESLGSFAAQILPRGTRLRHVEVGLRGPELVRDGKLRAGYDKLMSAAVLQGVLPAIRPDLAVRSINLINAPFLAEEVGVTAGVEALDEWVAGEEAEEAEGGEFQHVVRLRLVDSAGEHRQVLGSVVDGETRVVGVDHWRNCPTFQPVGTVLLLNNMDRPGTVHRVTKVLATSRVNIASFSVARQREGSPALSVLLVDQRLPRAVLDRLEALPGVMNVRTATFSDEELYGAA